MGLGYIGLPTAALMAKTGHDVIGVDVNPKAVDTINAGKIHIIENGLEALVSEVVKAGKLKAQLKPVEADAFIIAVPTPVQLALGFVLLVGAVATVAFSVILTQYIGVGQGLFYLEIKDTQELERN